MGSDRAGRVDYRRGMSFPAAHSMDTDWFALDADGRVGLFISDEPGAVPERGIVWCGPGGEEDGREAFWKLVGRSWLARVDDSEERPDAAERGHGLLACSSRAVADAAVKQGGVFLEKRGKKLWVVWPHEDPPDLDDTDYELIAFGDKQSLFETAGVYVYEADYDDGPIGVYHRASDAKDGPKQDAAAKAPADADDLPAHRFPVRFAESPELNVGQFVHATSWTHELDPEQGAVPLHEPAAVAAPPALVPTLIKLAVLIAIVVALVLLLRR